ALALRIVVETFAALPIAALSVPSGPVTGVFVTLGLLTAARGVPLIRAHIRTPRIAPPAFGTPRGALLALPAVLVAAVIAWPGTEPEVRVRALDVGQGDAYLVELGAATMLIDGGPDPARLMEEL